MARWQKLPAIDGKGMGCLLAGTAPETLHMWESISGEAWNTKISPQGDPNAPQ